MSTVIGISLYLFQTFDFLAVLREFGYPTYMAIVLFLYFRSTIKAKDNSLDTYRMQTLDEQRSQTDYLKSLLAETKTANTCRFEK